MDNMDLDLDADAGDHRLRSTTTTRAHNPGRSHSHPQTQGQGRSEAEDDDGNGHNGTVTGDAGDDNEIGKTRGRKLVEWVLSLPRLLWETGVKDLVFTEVRTLVRVSRPVLCILNVPV